MNDNNPNNRMNQQQTMSPNQWYPSMNPYGFYGMNQFGYNGFGPPPPFYPPGGFYPSQMPGQNMMNQQGLPPQMKGFVSGGKLETTIKKDDTNNSTTDQKKDETSPSKQADNNSNTETKPSTGENKMDIDLPPLPPGPAPPPYANFMPQTPPMCPPAMHMQGGLLPTPPVFQNNMMNGSPMRFNMNNFNKPRFNNNNQQNQQQQQQLNINMQGLSKKQRARMRKRLQKEADVGPPPAPQNRFQPPLPPGPPPPPGSAPPPPNLGGSNNSPSLAQVFPPPPEKQNNYKNILNSNLMGDWPDSLRSYISRALERCQTEADEQRVTKQLQNKITAAVNSNMLFIKDWAVEPLPLMENELSNVTIKPFQFNKANPSLAPSSPFQNNKPNSSLKQRLGAMNSTHQRFNKNSSSPADGNKKYNNRNSSSSSSDRYARKRRSSSSSSSSSNSDNDSNPSSTPDFIPLSRSKSSKKKSKYSENRNKKSNRNSKRFSNSHPIDTHNIATDSALLQKRAARFTDPAPSPSPRRTMTTTYSVNFDSFDAVGMGRGGDEGEGFDLSSCHVVGTCRDVEKQFFRLTAAPEPSMVRPPEVLEKSLVHVKQRWDASHDIVWTTSQLKSIRQDLTVQGIRDQFTVRVYETHARIALAANQHAEFNQCQNQLRLLYSELRTEEVPNRCEFTAYRILYYIFTKDTMDLTMTLGSLSPEDKADPLIHFALQVQAAWFLGHYHALFKLYKTAPLSAPHVMNLFIERERKLATAKLLKAYRPNLPLDFISRKLAFDDDSTTAIDSTSAIERTRLFLISLGAVFVDVDQNVVNCTLSCGAVAAALGGTAAS